MDNTIIYNDARHIADVCDLGQLAGKQMLITGASGLFGIYMLYTLKEMILRGIGPAQVYAVIHRDLPTALQEMEAESWLSFIRGDLADIDFCRSLPYADFVIHASGYGQPGKFLKDSVSAIRQNTLTTDILMEKLTSHGKFLYVSSGAVYAENPKEEYFEEDISYAGLDHPRICYIEGKRCGETICELYRRQGVDVKIVRPSFTYGPGVRKDDVRVLYEFIRKASSGKIQMRDHGKAVHVYEYISDAVEEMWNVLLHGKQSIYNIAGYSEISIYELAKRIAEILGAEVIVPVSDDTVPGAIMKQRVNSNRVETEFRKKTFVSMEDGLRATVDWYCSNYAEKEEQGKGMFNERKVRLMDQKK